MLKYQKPCQIILLILGVSMISYGAVRGEAATVPVSYTHLDVYKRQERVQIIGNVEWAYISEMTHEKRIEMYNLSLIHICLHQRRHDVL